MSGPTAHPEVDDGLLADAMAAYPQLGAVARIVRNGLSLNTPACLIETDLGRYFVKAHPLDRAGEAALGIGSEHALVTHLVDRRFPTPAVHRNGDGHTLTARDNFGFAVYDIAPGEDRYGRMPVFGPYGRLVEVAAAGSCLASLHLAWADLPAPPRTVARGMGISYDLLAATSLADGLDALGERFPALQQRLGDAGTRHGLETYLAPRHAALAPLWPALPRGLNHGDFIKRNLFWEGDAVSAVIDFGLWHAGPWVCDLALAALPCGFDWSALLHGHRGLRPDDLRVFVMAYDAVRPLTAAEWSALPVIMETARIEFYLSIVAAAQERGDEAEAGRFWQLLFGVLDWFAANPTWASAIR